jgi:glyoxylase-like metal-dependent hydrolase (beta-lactamase superfamily II)
VTKLGNYELKTLIVRHVQTNCYILSLDKDCILVDAAGDGYEILQYIKNNSLNLKTILITHGHYDHIEALDLLHKEFPDVKIYACDAEKEVIEDKTKSLMDHELDSTTQNAITYITDGTIINTLDLDIKFINTPGHTIGSGCFYIEKLNILFSGDTLFKDTYGRYDLPTGDAKQIAKSIAVGLMKFNDDIVVYPGHGFKTTIGHERENNDIIKYYKNIE